MREILFRGKDACGRWFEGGYYENNTGKYIISPAFVAHLVDPETVGQYTGLTDKNGRKIFEGDIVVFADFFNDEIHRGVVYWCDLAFWFDCTETEGDEGIYSLAYISANILEVIGNIYDNPEMLEGS